MTKIKEIRKIINIMKFKKDKLAILHCISDYPTDLKDSKLGAIDQIKEFGYEVGFSDHTLGSEAAIAAISKGSSIIENN